MKDSKKTTKNPERSSFFPAIEKKHGKPASHWLKLLTPLRGRPYAEQMALLQGRHGFSRAHANALVMYFRGSKSSRRFSTLAEYVAKHPDERGATLKKIFAAARKASRDAEVVIAWNQPMLKVGDTYVFGVSAMKTYLLLGIFDADVRKQMAPRFKDYERNKKTVRLPSDWKVDAKLLEEIVVRTVGTSRNHSRRGA
ncbi:MAG: DUF4287 domain-containing protein [Ilumatobacteraceae bacterium]